MTKNSKIGLNKLLQFFLEKKNSFIKIQETEAKKENKWTHQYRKAKIAEDLIQDMMDEVIERFGNND